MAYVKKSTTLILFFLLIITIAVFILSIFFYQRSMTNLNDAVRVRGDELETQADVLNSLRQNYSDVSEMLNVQIKREENLSGLFTDLRSQKQSIEDQKKQTEGRLNETESTLNNALTQISLLQQDLDKALTQKESLNNTLQDVLDDAQIICDKSASINISQCKKYT